MGRKCGRALSHFHQWRVTFLLSGGRHWLPLEMCMWQKCWPRWSIQLPVCWHFRFCRFSLHIQDLHLGGSRHESLTSSRVFRQQAGTKDCSTFVLKGWIKYLSRTIQCLASWSVFAWIVNLRISEERWLIQPTPPWTLHPAKNINQCMFPVFKLACNLNRWWMEPQLGYLSPLFSLCLCFLQIWANDLYLDYFFMFIAIYLLNILLLLFFSPFPVFFVW